MYIYRKVIKRYIKYISEDIVHVVAPLYDDIDGKNYLIFLFKFFEH